MNQELTTQYVPIIVQFKSIVQNLVQARKQAGFTQQFIAEWLEVDRRKIIALENGTNFDLLLLNNYADKLSMELKLNAY